MGTTYSISDFYLFLKLGIWNTGEVANWGRIDKLIILKNIDNFCCADNVKFTTFTKVFFLLRKPLSYYICQPFSKQILTNGIYLLDFYLQSRKTEDSNTLRTYIMIISIGRFGLDKKESIYVLKISNHLDENKFRSAILSGKEITRRKR